MPSFQASALPCPLLESLEGGTEFQRACSSDDNESQTTTAKNCCFETTQNLLKIIQCSCGIRVPEIPNIPCKSNILALYLHPPREAGLTSVLRQRCSRSHCTAFQRLISPFMNCPLETPTSLYPPQRSLG